MPLRDDVASLLQRYGYRPKSTSGQMWSFYHPAVVEEIGAFLEERRNDHCRLQLRVAHSQQLPEVADGWIYAGPVDLRGRREVREHYAATLCRADLPALERKLAERFPRAALPCATPGVQRTPQPRTVRNTPDAARRAPQSPDRICRCRRPGIGVTREKLLGKSYDELRDLVRERGNEMCERHDTEELVRRLVELTGQFQYDDLWSVSAKSKRIYEIDVGIGDLVRPAHMFEVKRPGSNEFNLVSAPGGVAFEQNRVPPGSVALRKTTPTRYEPVRAGDGVAQQRGHSLSLSRFEAGLQPDDDSLARIVRPYLTDGRRWLRFRPDRFLIWSKCSEPLDAREDIVACFDLFNDPIGALRDLLLG